MAINIQLVHVRTMHLLVANPVVIKGYIMVEVDLPWWLYKDYSLSMVRVKGIYLLRKYT